ncbi:MAG: ATP-binding cassette domain-containing protein [Cyanobacteria bacterium P01_G01_bin.39]
MSNQDSESTLHLEQVSLLANLGSDLLLQNISFKVRSGEKIGIIGTSGAGKTSLLRLLNNLVSPHEGQIYLQNVRLEQLVPVALRRRIVLVNQEPKLLGMRVIDALSYPLRLQNISQPEIRNRVDSYASLLRLPSEWMSKTELQLSLGQRQLVAIARGLMMQPEIILLDEPTSALDVGTASNLLAVLRELNQSQNLTILLVTHQLELLQGFCDRLLLLNQGFLEEDIPATASNCQRLSQKILELQTRQEQDWL